MSNSWNDRRAAPRNQVAYRFDAWDDRGNFLGCILDMSTLGVRVLLMEDIDVQKVKGLRFDLPRWMNMGPHVEVKGGFVWSKDPRDNGEREAGFSFDAISAAQLKKMERLIKSLVAVQQSG